MQALRDSLAVPVFLNQLSTVRYIILPHIMLSTIASKAQQIFKLTLMASLGVAVVHNFLNLKFRFIINLTQEQEVAGLCHQPCRASGNRHEIHHVFSCWQVGLACSPKGQHAQ